MKTEQTQFKDNYALPEADTIICPWCFGMTTYNPEQEICCSVCSREITAEDLINNQSNER